MATPSRRSSKSRTARRKVAKVPRLRRCGTMSVHHRLLERDPGFRQRQIALEHACARRMARREFRLAGAPITVPTVVHIVYNTSAENVSDSQVRSQIRVLNQDYVAKQWSTRPWSSRPLTTLLGWANLGASSRPFTGLAVGACD